MILNLEVAKVRAESYKGKDGNQYNALDLICVDKGEGKRLGSSVTFVPNRGQKDQLTGLDLRDKKIVCDIEEVFVNPRGAIVFRGDVLNLEELTGGPLKAEKPEGKATAKP